MASDDTRTAMDWEARFSADEAPWERPGLHPAFLDWRQQGVFKSGERVIVPGCGRSPELARYAKAGLDVVGADLSRSAIAFQRHALESASLDAELIEGDVLEQRFEARFDFVYEQTFLCAIPPRLRGEYEAATHDWLKPGGRLLALFMQKEERGGPPYDCSLEAMRELFPADR
jgi:SAM-dependent methyltransferase